MEGTAPATVLFGSPVKSRPTVSSVAIDIAPDSDYAQINTKPRRKAGYGFIVNSEEGGSS
jgi:hypothetical protein